MSQRNWPLMSTWEYLKGEIKTYIRDFLSLANFLIVCDEYLLLISYLKFEEIKLWVVFLLQHPGIRVPGKSEWSRKCLVRGCGQSSMCSRLFVLWGMRSQGQGGHAAAPRNAQSQGHWDGVSLPGSAAMSLWEAGSMVLPHSWDWGYVSLAGGQAGQKQGLLCASKFLEGIFTLSCQVLCCCFSACGLCCGLVWTVDGCQGW